MSIIEKLQAIKIRNEQQAISENAWEATDSVLAKVAEQVAEWTQVELHNPHVEPSDKRERELVLDAIKRALRAQKELYEAAKKAIAQATNKEGWNG